jgi:hypothetical protein
MRCGIVMFCGGATEGYHSSFFSVAVLGAAHRGILAHEGGSALAAMLDIAAPLRHK